MRVFTSSQLIPFGKSASKTFVSHTRVRVYEGMARFVRIFEERGIPSDLWIDGGSLTESIDPPDVDVVLCADSEFYDGCCQEQKETIDWIDKKREQIKKEFSCEAYLSLVWPVGHRNHHDGKVTRAQWRDWYGFSRRQIALLRALA